MRGPLPDGTWSLQAGGFEPTHDGHLHVELDHVTHAGASTTLWAGDHQGTGQSDGGNPDNIAAQITPGPLGACGDSLVLHVTLVSGSSDYLEFGAGITLP